MPKLSDTQAILLSAAATRADRSLLPLPATPKLKGAALERSLKALLDRGLIAEVSARGPDATSTDPEVDSSEGKRLVITSAGLDAIGAKNQRASGHADGRVPPAQRAIPEQQGARPAGKLGALLDAVSRPEGASLEELSAAADWLPHTTRAAISRLRQRGYDVRIATMGTRKAYHLLPAA